MEIQTTYDFLHQLIKEILNDTKYLDLLTNYYQNKYGIIITAFNKEEKITSYFFCLLNVLHSLLSIDFENLKINGIIIEFSLPLTNFRSIFIINEIYETFYTVKDFEIIKINYIKKTVICDTILYDFIHNKLDNEVKKIIFDFVIEKDNKFYLSKLQTIFGQK